MREYGTWSISLGRWAGIRVRLHVFFCLFAAFTLFLAWRVDQRFALNDHIWIAALSLIILAASVLLHEVGHCHTALQLGAIVDQIVLGPFGGMTPVHHVHFPRRDLLIASVGPLVNLFLCVACLPLLYFSNVDSLHALFHLLHPLQPLGLMEGGAFAQALKLVFWINWLLFVVNLMPVYPFDGGRMMRAALLILWPEMGTQSATVRVARATQFGAFGLLIAAWLIGEPGQAGLLPTWFALVLFWIFLLFAAQQEVERCDEDEREEEFFGYDFSQGYTSLDQSVESRPVTRRGPLARWLAKRREVRQQRQRELEAEEEHRMDEILSRLHAGGIKGLSAEDRRVLDRVSARYRSRMDQ